MLHEACDCIRFREVLKQAGIPASHPSCPMQIWISALCGGKERIREGKEILELVLQWCLTVWFCYATGKKRTNDFAS